MCVKHEQLSGQFILQCSELMWKLCILPTFFPSYFLMKCIVFQRTKEDYIVFLMNDVYVPSWVGQDVEPQNLNYA